MMSAIAHWIGITAFVGIMATLSLQPVHAWDNAQSKSKATDDVGAPDKVADRLKIKMDVDFRRTPLQEAFAFVGDKIKTKIEIEGDALKAGGFTKNMPQTFSGDGMTALEVIAKVLEKYQDPNKPSNTMVIVVNEEKKTITVMTKAFADQQKLTPYEVFKK